MWLFLLRYTTEICADLHFSKHENAANEGKNIIVNSDQKLYNAGGDDDEYNNNIFLRCDLFLSRIAKTIHTHTQYT